MKLAGSVLCILALPVLSAFGCARSDSLEERLRLHVYALAADSMEGRGIRTIGLAKAAAHIETQLEELDLDPLKPWGRFDSFIGPDSSQLKNILAKISSSEHDSTWILITAHYDHLGLMETEEGGTEPYNGAHDNASGVAVALEASRLLSHVEIQGVGIALVIFSAEEEGLIGSRHFVANLHENAVRIRAVINIDAVGHLIDDSFLLVGIQGQPTLDMLITEAAGANDLSTIRAAKSYASGDHAPFLEAGIPAVQITTGPHVLMNTILDDPETLDYEGMTRLCRMVCTLVMELSSSDISLESPPPPLSSGPPSTKRVRFGIVPDFAYSLRGVRAQGVMPDSPAQTAGLKAGDVVYGLGMREIDSLKGLSDALRNHADGDSVTVFFRRGGIAMQTMTVLEKR